MVQDIKQIKSLNVFTNGAKQGVLTKDSALYDFTYSSDAEEVVSLTMPLEKPNWRSKPNVLHPIFQMNLPEGALKEKIKEHFGKISVMDDMGILELVGPHMLGKIKFGYPTSSALKPVSLSDLLHPSEENYFESLMETFAIKSGISGVQPKILIDAVDRHTLKLENLIVKAWKDEHPELAANEYFCMRVCKNSGLNVPDFYLSEDRKMFIMKRFDVNENLYLGFEDMCVMLSKTTDEKYDSSYEDVAKVIKSATGDNCTQDLEDFFKVLIVNHLVRNGDAHLKNFGLLYEDGSNNCRLAPIYDVVTTTVYNPKDIPALRLSGGKTWWKEKTYLNFAKLTCKIPENKIREIIATCEDGINKTKIEIDDFVTQNPDFALFAKKLTSQWQLEFIPKKEIEVIKKYPESSLKDVVDAVNKIKGSTSKQNLTP